MRKPIKILLPVLLAGLVLSSGALATSGCSSSKPAYCGDRDQLEQSVKGLTDISPSAGSVSAYQDQLNEIQDNAGKTLDSARQDFPEETDAVESSIGRLADTIENLPKSPSTSDILMIVGEGASLASAVQQFNQATKSACD